MSSLFYMDSESNSIKELANTDSPSFINEPLVAKKSTLENKSVLNVKEVVEYVDSIVAEYDATRFFSSNNNTLQGLTVGATYMISVYGTFNSGTADTYNLGPVALKDNSGNILKTSGNLVKNQKNPKMIIPQSAVLIVSNVPEDGKILGYVNYNNETNTSTNASYMLAVRLS